MSYGPAARLRSSTIKSKSKKPSEALPPRTASKATTFQPPYHFSNDSLCPMDPNGKCEVILKSTSRDTLSSLKCKLCTNDWGYGEAKWECIYNECPNTFCCRCLEKDKKTIQAKKTKSASIKPTKPTKPSLKNGKKSRDKPLREPEHVSQITEIHNFDKISYGIHVFNSLVLDKKLRWFSQAITKKYFETEKEFNDYMHIVDNNPMDFTTIKRKIYNNKYADNNLLFCDMELAFKNAMIFNKKGCIWYDEAYRLNKILFSLKNKQIINDSSWKTYDNNCRLCLQCHNIMLASKSIQPIIMKCNNCSLDIKCKENDYFICYNGYHNHTSAVFCRKCVKKCVYLANNNNNNNNAPICDDIIMENDRDNAENKNDSNINGFSLIGTLFTPPSDINESKYRSSIWRSMNTFSTEMMVANDRYQTAISRKRKRKRKLKVTSNNANVPLKKRKLNKNVKVNVNEPIYKIRRPKSAWMLYNVFKINDLLPQYPSLSICERTKISGKTWKNLSEKKKRKWIKKAEKEKMKYVEIKQEYEKHKDFNKVPQKWKQIDKKAEKERKQNWNQQ